MRGPDLDRPAFFALVDEAEGIYPYVSAERLRRLARAIPELSHLSRQLSAHIRSGLADDSLLCDNRLRLRRDGTFQPIRIYRLNRRHPAVQEALG